MELLHDVLLFWLVLVDFLVALVDVGSIILSGSFLVVNIVGLVISLMLEKSLIEVLTTLESI